MDCANRQYSVEWENYHEIKSNLEPFVLLFHNRKLRRMLALYAAVKNEEEQDILRIIPRQINIRKFLRNEKKAQKEAEVELKVPSRFKLPTFHQIKSMVKVYQDLFEQKQKKLSVVEALAAEVDGGEKWIQRMAKAKMKTKLKFFYKQANLKEIRGRLMKGIQGDGDDEDDDSSLEEGSEG
jgi:hypothetical protein